MKLSIVAAVAALSTFGIASSASAMCGPNVSFGITDGYNNSINNTKNDSIGVAEGYNTFNDSKGTNGTQGSTFNLTANISFQLDGGRSCALLDEQIAVQKDNRLRAARQAYLQEQQQASQLINNLMASIQYCEAADLSIPANVEFCTNYLSK